MMLFLCGTTTVTFILSLLMVGYIFELQDDIEKLNRKIDGEKELKAATMEGRKVNYDG